MTRPLLAVVAVVILGAHVLGQAQQPGVATAALPAFDAASIKAPDPNGIGAIDIRIYPNRFVATTVTLSQLIEYAYGIQSREIAGGPDWVRVERFDVTATAGRDVDRQQMQFMLQTLLADRFQLQIVREERTGTIYRLTAPRPRGLNPPAKPDERPVVTQPRNDRNGFLSYEYAGHNATMEQLAVTLGGQLRVPVINETKLSGNYDFTVAWTYSEAFGGLQPDPNIPTIFSALERDLGLKLVADKGPVPVYVIRRASKPSAN